MPDGCDFETPVEALRRIRAERDSLRSRLQEALRLLREAHVEFCSNCCPSVKRIGTEWKHSVECRKMQELLDPAPKTTETLPKHTGKECKCKGCGVVLGYDLPAGDNLLCGSCFVSNKG